MCVVPCACGPGAWDVVRRRGHSPSLAALDAGRAAQQQHCASAVWSQASSQHCVCVCAAGASVATSLFPFFSLPTRRPRYAINLLQGPVGLELWPAFSLNSAIFCRGLLLGLHAGSRYRLIVRTLTCYEIRYYLSHSPCSPSSH